MRIGVALLLTVATGVATAGERGFSLRLDQLTWTPSDPRTAERLAEWDAPLGRVALALAEQQARLGAGPSPRASGAVAVRLRARRGLPLHLVSAVTAGGVELSETTVAVIRWPWEEEPGTAPLSVDEQLALLLGRRLAPR